MYHTPKQYLLIVVTYHVITYTLGGVTLFFHNRRIKSCAWNKTLWKCAKKLTNQSGSFKNVCVLISESSCMLSTYVLMITLNCHEIQREFVVTVSESEVVVQHAVRFHLLFRIALSINDHSNRPPL